MHRPVLGCATDLGPSGERALAHCIALARGSGAHVALLHAVEDADESDPLFLAEPMNPVLAAYREKLAARKREALEGLEASSRSLAEAGIPCSIELASGRPWTAVLSAARRVGVDLLVLGPHGLTPATGAHLRLPRLLGSTSDPAVRHADRPVLVCPAEPAAPSAAPRRALVAIDFGPTSAVVLEWAARMRAAFGLEPTLLHVLRGSAAGSLDGASEPAGLEARARARLASLAGEGGLGGVPIRVVSAPSASEAIAIEAEALGAPYVVVGAGAAPPWAQAFLGSTAEELVRHGGHAVVVVRRPSEGFALTDAGPAR